MLPPREEAPGFTELGVSAFTTTREAGSYGTQSDEPASQVMERWYDLADSLSEFGPRLVTGRQVHGTRIVGHGGGWEGWLRVNGADGHIAQAPGTALAVTVADCVPVFIGHPSGVVALLHAGWRGTAARILPCALELLDQRGIRARETLIHLGPAICGLCYEVSADVFGRLTGRTATTQRTVDLRDILSQQASEAGVRSISASASCTGCNNDRFFSHRARDLGRQLGIIVKTEA
ncbi:MAG: polyphenol oxidase family protein [Gemmatimonadaceae bacterium]